MNADPPTGLGPCVAVVHQPGATTRVGELVGQACDVTPVTIRRDMLRELVTAGASAIVVDHVDGDFDVNRVCSDIRSVVSTRLMVISSRVADDEAAHIAALDAGADDVVPSDTSPQVVLARVRAMLRVAEGRTRVALIQLGDLRIDFDAHLVHIADLEVPCPHLQFKLLTLFVRRPRVLVTREEIVAELWGRTDPNFPNRARVAVSALRRVLRRGQEIGYLVPVIDAVSKVGYRMSLPEGVATSSWMTTNEGRRIRLAKI
jgi:DNA-binding response OmpR family regulator